MYNGFKSYDNGSVYISLDDESKISSVGIEAGFFGDIIEETDYDKEEIIDCLYNDFEDNSKAVSMIDRISIETFQNIEIRGINSLKELMDFVIDLSLIFCDHDYYFVENSLNEIITYISYLDGK